MENLIFHMGFTDRGIIWNAIRGLFSWFDTMIYTVLGWFFQTIFYIANFQMNILYEEMQTRVYVVLGIFMLFKLVISFLTYLVNPDKMSDKEQGVGKLVTRVIIVLVMFIALPTLFTVMTELQNRLIPVVPRLIIGQAAGGDFFDDSKTGVEAMDIEGLGNTMALNVYRAFLRTNDSPQCGAVGQNNTDPNDVTVSLWSSVSEAADAINDPCPNDKNMYLYTYTPIIPLVVGIIMVVVVVGINLDVGIRAFKILILRAIAPVPVLSYIDPKSSKDGAFSKWSKMLFSTWLSLFINLGIVYFIIYIIGMLFTGEVWANFFGNWSPDNPVISSLALILIVIALLFFAREAPQFIMDALGIKSAGSFGKMLGLAASGLGMVGAGRAAYQASRSADETLEKGHGFLNTAKNFGAGLLGGISGGVAGAQAALGAKDHHIRAGMDAISKRNATAIARGSAGSTAFGRAEASMQRFFGGETDYERMSREKTGYETANKAILGYKNTLEKKALEKTTLKIDLDDKHKGINYLEFMSHTEGAKNGNAESLQWFIDRGFSKQVQNGTKRVWDASSHSYIDEPQYKTVADWQDAQLYLDKIKDLQTQAHGRNLVAAVEKYERDGDTSVFTDYGTEYNDYRLASDAAKDVNLKVDFSTYGIKGADASKGDTVGIKQALGETNKHVTGVVTDAGYKAAKANADATKK